MTPVQLSVAALAVRLEIDIGVGATQPIPDPDVVVKLLPEVYRDGSVAVQLTGVQS